MNSDRINAEECLARRRVEGMEEEEVTRLEGRVGSGNQPTEKLSWEQEEKKSVVLIIALTTRGPMASVIYVNKSMKLERYTQHTSR